MERQFLDKMDVCPFFSFSPLFFFSEKNIHVIMKYKIHFGGYGLVSDTLPKFYDKGYQEYTFTVKESDLLGNNKGKYYLKHRGVYIITVDLNNMMLEVIEKN
jgi:hypothetical protein